MSETAQVELHYEVAGEGPPVVLVHEGIADSRMWEPQWTSFPRAASDGPLRHARLR